MRKIKMFLVAAVLFTGCNHDFDTDKSLGNVSEYYGKIWKKQMEKKMDALKKELESRPKPKADGSGWYSSKETKIKPGRVIQFFPGPGTDIDGQSGPFLVVTEDSTGKRSISEVSKKIWIIIKTGDIVK